MFTRLTNMIFLKKLKRSDRHDERISSRVFLMKKGVILNTIIFSFLGLVCFGLSGLLFNHASGWDASATAAFLFLGLGFFSIWVIIKVYREPDWDLFKGMEMDY